MSGQRGRSSGVRRTEPADPTFRQTEAEAERRLLKSSLRVSSRTDPLEREADRIADRLAGRSSRPLSVTSGNAQVGRRDRAPATADEAIATPGVPIESKFRAAMEGHFGHDFSRVRLHTGPLAERSARELGANAYTVGRDVVFGHGRLNPGTNEGRRLLVHELAHVVQQTGGAPLSGRARRGPPEGTGRSALMVARDDGPGAPKPEFKVNQGDIDYLQKQVRAMMDGLDPKTRERILSRDTVAVGLVVDPDGDPTLVYTVAGNRTYPELRKQANKLGIVRWEAEPRAKGRGDVGAPGDAEQLMFEAADANSFRVAGMAVTRAVCADCKEAVKAEQKGGVPVVHVDFARPKAPGGRAASPTKKGAAKATADAPPAKKGPGAGTGPGSTKRPPPTKAPAVQGAPKAAPAQKVPSKATSQPTPATPAKGQPGAKSPAPATPKPASKGTPLGGTTGKAGAQGATARTGGSRGGGGAVGVAVAGAIVDVIGGIVTRAMVQDILDEKNGEAIDRDIKALQPKIEARAAALETRIKELAEAGGPVFISVKLKVRWQTDTSGQLGGGTAYMGMDVAEIRAESTKHDKVKTEAVQEGIGDVVREQFGATAQYWTFSLSYPDLEVVSASEPPPPAPPCFIATACYGTPFAPDVDTLRQFRDRVLARSRGGRVFMRIYYRSSPPVAHWLARHALPRRLVREFAVAPIASLIRRRERAGGGKPDLSGGYG